MAYSLLAHLYPHIRGSQEDIATYSLQYLLMQSNNLNRAFTRRIAETLQLELENSLQYVCQVTGASKEKERPDMVGITKSGKESVLCEMKFYATLTSNQPGTYLKRLQDNNGEGLIFICPVARRTSLWVKLQELCSEYNITEISDSCIDVDGIRMAIMTWSEIIEMLKQVSSTTDLTFLSDIMQLEGYCNQMDSDAFIPFSAQDLSAEMAIKGERYYQVIDEVMELLCADKSICTSKKGTKATAYRRGYTRSLTIDEFSITLNYDRELWKNPVTVETPFWVAIRNNTWEQTQEIIDKIKLFPEIQKENFWNMIFLSLNALEGATFSEVSEDLKNQIMKYIEMIRE